MPNFFRIAVAITIGVAAVAGDPVSLRAQRDAHLRNDCRLAGQVLRTGHPAPRRLWAWSVISSCSDSAGAVLAGVWRAPAERELAQLWGVSYRVRDARLTRAVLTAFRDPSRSRAERLTAARVLASHAVPDLVVLESDLARLRADSVHPPYLSVDHSDVREGSVPVTSALVGEIREAFVAVGECDADAEVRTTARLLARQVRMHMGI